MAPRHDWGRARPATAAGQGHSPSGSENGSALRKQRLVRALLCGDKTETKRNNFPSFGNSNIPENGAEDGLPQASRLLKISAKLSSAKEERHGKKTFQVPEFFLGRLDAEVIFSLKVKPHIAATPHSQQRCEKTLIVYFSFSKQLSIFLSSHSLLKPHGVLGEDTKIHLKIVSLF